MAARQSRGLLRPLLYGVGAAALGGGILYVSYRPRNIPGSDDPAVRLTFGPDGTVAPPRFPKVKRRDEQIAELKKSSGIKEAIQSNAGSLSGLFGSGQAQKVDDEQDEEPYDLLIIGGGATGSGIALDAATRGLKVAVIERDDFSSGTSSKSTKLVHGGVRYLEKAVWELDYNQYADFAVPVSLHAHSGQVCTGKGSIA
jgi:glycerol-3-phosphate dehydrogenase